MGAEILLSASDLSASIGGVGAEILLSSAVNESKLANISNQIGIEDLTVNPYEFNIGAIASQIDIGDISVASSGSTTISNLSIQIVLEEV